jgi:hypothetical protein
MTEISPSKHPQALSILAEIQCHIYDNTIPREVNRIAKRTKDKFILDVCNRIAVHLGIEIDLSLDKINPNKQERNIKALANHLNWANQRFKDVEKIKDECDSKWISSVFKETQLQLLNLSNYYILLDKIPDITDLHGEVVELGDLVFIPCKDEKGNSYDHYGIVIATPQGFNVTHFFTGQTVRSQNSLVEWGFGYVQQVEYQPQWIVKQHLRSLDIPVPYHRIIERIEYSKSQDRKIWDKHKYNCEHWAREMFSGMPKCTQIKDKKRILKIVKTQIVTNLNCI